MSHVGIVGEQRPRGQWNGYLHMEYHEATISYRNGNEIALTGSQKHAGSTTFISAAKTM
jgi:hypothetical protein